MNLVGMMLARNEAHEIGLTARVALRWCDTLLILDHASTDDTPRIINALGHEFPEPHKSDARRESRLERNGASAGTSVHGSQLRGHAHGSHRCG